MGRVKNVNSHTSKDLPPRLCREAWWLGCLHEYKTISFPFRKLSIFETERLVHCIFEALMYRSCPWSLSSEAHQHEFNCKLQTWTQRRIGRYIRSAMYLEDSCALCTAAAGWPETCQTWLPSEPAWNSNKVSLHGFAPDSKNDVGMLYDAYFEQVVSSSSSHDTLTIWRSIRSNTALHCRTQDKVLCIYLDVCARDEEAEVAE